MRIDLPDLSEQPYHFSVCGKLIEPSEEVEKAISEEKRLIAEYSIGGKKYFVQLLTGRTKHFHLEFARADWFVKKAPRVNADILRLEQEADAISGLHINLRLQGEYSVLFQDLQKAPLMSTVPLTSNAEGVTVRQISGEFLVDGSSVERISWELMDQEAASLRLSLKLEADITPAYCVEALKHLRTHFNSLFLNAPDEH